MYANYLYRCNRVYRSHREELYPDEGEFVRIAHTELVIETQDEVLAQSVARALAKIGNMSLFELAVVPAYREDEAERIRVRPMTLGTSKAKHSCIS